MPSCVCTGGLGHGSCDCMSCAILTGAMAEIFFCCELRHSRGDGYESRRNSKEHLFVMVLRLGRVRLGIFRNKNVFRNIFRLFCSQEQNSQNGIQVLRNENSPQTNAYLHYSNYAYSGLSPNERTLSHVILICTHTNQDGALRLTSSLHFL